MALNKLVDSRDVRFVLFEMLKVDELGKFEKYSGFDKDMYEDTLQLAEKMAVEQIYPTNADGDKTGVTYDPDKKLVKAPESFRAPLKAFNEAGFVGIFDDSEVGGMGLPHSVGFSCYEYFCTANVSLTTYPALAHGAAALFMNYASDELKNIYLGKMLSGTWGGTMCLTESDAGSDVGALKARAYRQSDGTFKIVGQKIFITAGDNDLYENIIHPVLARIEGDPPGTKGISIFLVPKYLVNPDGSVGASNDVVCSGIEHKCGIHGSATCTLSFGDNDNCRGWLLGQERQGMKIMFQLMNEARTDVAIQGLSVASTAYMHSISYAKNRKQGAHITQMMNPEAPQVAIIEHPDVKRMLLWMKSYVEGMRMLTYYLSHHLDLEHVYEGDAQKEAKALIDILIPICKAGNTDTGVLVASEAMQVYGGYGYCADYPVEQFYRDAKIFAIYEGTNGIQSMDLTMRKILMNKDQYNYQVWKKRVDDVVKKAKGVVEDKYIDLVVKGVAKLDETIEFLKGQMAKGAFMNLFMNASQLRKGMFMVCLAWLHLWSMTLCTPKMKELLGEAKGEEREKILADNAEAAFYAGKVLAGQFFIGYEFPEYFGKLDSILGGESAVIKASRSIFTGAPEE